MTAATTFEIGTTFAGMQTCTVIGIPEPEMEPVDFAESDVLANLVERGRGFPQCNAHFGYLTAAQYTVIRSYCPALSTEIYVALLNSDGDFVRYFGVMTMPKNYSIRNLRRLDLTITFTRLVAAE